jgi:hypothetical protein
MMEPLSHYHCEIYYCKPVPINLYQTTYTNNLNHASTMHQPVPQPVINCTINKWINHAPTCTKQPVINLYHKQVHQPCTNLYLNLYHEQVHQPCTKPIQITYHNNFSKQPITTTCLINLINQIRYTHQYQSPRQLSKMCINQA